METAPRRQIIIEHLFDIRNHLDTLNWEPFRPGVKIHRLYGDQATGPSAAFLLYEPGAGIPLHEHLGYEHLFILSDTQTDNDAEHHFGTFIINVPGTSHAVSVPLGGIVLAIWEKPVKLAPAP